MASISHNISAAAISRVAINGIGLLIVGVLARVLGSDGFGQYNTVFAYLFLFNALADLGLYSLLVRDISRPGADEKYIVGNLFTLRFVVVICSLVIANIIVLLLPYDDIIKTGVLVGSVSIICSSLVQILLGIFQKHLKLYLISISDVIARLLQLGLIALLIEKGFHGVVLFVWVVVAVEMVHLILVLFFARRISRFPILFDMAYWKKSLVSALPIAISLVFVLIYFKIDTVMLSLMKSAQDVAEYSLAYKVLEVAIFFPAVYVGLIMPFLSRSAHDLMAFRTHYQKALKVLAFTAIPAVIGTFFLAGFVTKIVGGPGYGGSTPLLQILSLAIGIIFFGNLGGNALIALNLQRKGAWLYGIGALVNVVLNLIFIPRFGALAAAWNTVLTELLVTILMFAVIEKAIKRINARL